MQYMKPILLSLAKSVSCLKLMLYCVSHVGTDSKEVEEDAHRGDECPSAATEIPALLEATQDDTSEGVRAAAAGLRACPCEQYRTPPLSLPVFQRRRLEITSCAEVPRGASRSRAYHWVSWTSKTRNGCFYLSPCSSFGRVLGFPPWVYPANSIILLPVTPPGVLFYPALHSVHSHTDVTVKIVH